jgi:hypothetical protein
VAGLRFGGLQLPPIRNLPLANPLRIIALEAMGQVATPGRGGMTCGERRALVFATA